MQVTDAVIPGPTYLEAMEDDESGAKVYKIEMKCQVCRIILLVSDSV